MEDVVSILETRGLIDNITDPALSEHLSTPRKIYVGFDPTADSLHVGNLVGILVLKWFQKAGHIPVVIFGGATAAIGDPGGKSQERPLLSFEQIAHNVSSIGDIFRRVLDFDSSETQPVLLNNADWLQSFSVIEFLRDVGKHFRMGPMLAKEMVKTRIESPAGLSFTEFSYQVLQGFDFYHLLQEHDVTVQFGGSDQWGNIVSGTDLIRKTSDKTVFGGTWKLLTKSDGTKFGKTESGAVWLNEDKCSPFQFYQFFVRQSDQDIINLMRMLTFIPMEEIQEYEKNLGSHPGEAQKRLAFAVTSIVHGEEKAKQAQSASVAAKPGSKIEISEETLANLKDQIPTFSIERALFLEKKLLDLLVELKIAPSKSQVRRLIENGGLNLNEGRITDPNYTFSQEDLVGKFCLVGLGKKNKFLVFLTD